MSLTTEANDSYKQDGKLLQDLLDTEHALESPIDLDIARMRVIELDPLKWIGIDIAPRKLKLTNTGLTVILSAKWPQACPYLSGGPYEGNYVFAQIHFHWGENEMKGSEHSVDGARFEIYFKSSH
ncbi:putative carbonic anhydrase 3 [Bombus terrestris]|uniref:Carbonic anhydrase 3 n=1 Tax=Bombus terrestris TaxID=30195 RepID=A0A9C6SXG6_BOMTE|nr:putative carbonic anhydrase 3 [Bombus terrestris]